MISAWRGVIVESQIGIFCGSREATSGRRKGGIRAADSAEGESAQDRPTSRLRRTDRATRSHAKALVGLLAIVIVREALTRSRDADFWKFNARGEEIELIKSKYKQMELLLESHEKTRDKLEDEARWDCCICRRLSRAHDHIQSVPSPKPSSGGQACAGTEKV